MAGTITSAGIGSGIDVESLITKLMSLERQPVTKLQSQDKSYSTKLSAFGTLKSNLSALQTAADALSVESKFAAFKANIADSGVASAAVGSTAAAGSYQLEVSSLASAQKVVTSAQASNYTFADGTLSLDVGGTVTNIDISAASNNNSLTGVRNAINAANAGVTATLLDDGTGTRLILSSTETGKANAVTLTGLGLDFDPDNIAASGTLVDQTTSKAATDAVFKLDGIEVSRPTNVFSDALDGVTLTLNKTNIGDPTTLSVTQDGPTIEDKVKAFVTAYNNVLSNIKSQTAYNADTKIAGTLNGDAAVRSIQSQLRNLVSGTLAGGSLTRLIDIGIDVTKDGTLSLDSTKFQEVLADPTKNVAAVFAESGGVKGFASLISGRIDAFFDSDGLLTSRTDGIKKSQVNLSKQIETLNTRLDAVEERYRRQFSALDSTVASWSSTGSYLTQQLGSLLTKYTNNY